MFQKLSRTIYLFLPHLLAVCKVGGISILILLREVKCRWCHIYFCVCWSCWRGQAYCSDECRIVSRLHAHREAQKRYRETAEGQRTHREAERRRRMRRAKKNVDDRGSTHIFARCKIPSSYTEPTVEEGDRYERVGVEKSGRCQFCGSSGTIVNKFPRRGYGKSNLQAPMTRSAQVHSKQKRIWAEKRYPQVRRKGEKMKSFLKNVRGILF